MEDLRQNIICQFCGEPDFDLIGLKNHYTKGHCEKYNDTDDPAPYCQYCGAQRKKTCKCGPIADNE